MITQLKKDQRGKKDKKDLRDKKDKKDKEDKKDKKDKEDKNVSTVAKKAIFRGNAMPEESTARENPDKTQVNVTTAMRWDISQEIAQVIKVLYR